MNQIDCFIVGAQKCGTTSLKNYMGEHPQVNAQVQTEMTFFVDDSEFEQGISSMFEKYFKPHENEKVNVAKYVSMCSNEKGLKRLHAHNPDCKIIYMVREPIKRASSSYLMEYRQSSEKRDFDTVIKNILVDKDSWQFRTFLGLGIYIDYIRTLLTYFPEKNLKVIVLEEFEKNPKEVMADLFKWLDIDKGFVPDLAVVHNQGGREKSKYLAKLIHSLLNEKSLIKKLLKKIISPQTASKLGVKLRGLNVSKQINTIDMSEETKDALVRFYTPYNEELENFLEREHSIWK